MTDWCEFSRGESLGSVGSEGGTILLDEVYGDAVRLTLERAGRVAPFAITCGVSGWLVHTRFFESEPEARSQLAAMKLALARIADAVMPGTDDGSLRGQLCAEFVEAFP
jgi:hypothetical protein